MTQSTPNGLESNYWVDPDIAGTPDWAKELLEIPGVDAVRKLTHGVVSVDTQVWFDEDGFAEPSPEVIEGIKMADGMSLGGWGIQQVTVKEDGNNSQIRIRLGASTPECRADGCYNPATHEIHGIVLDGSTFRVYACDEH